MKTDAEYLEFMWPMRHFLITCGDIKEKSNIIAVYVADETFFNNLWGYKGEIKYHSAQFLYARIKGTSTHSLCYRAR